MGLFRKSDELFEIMSKQGPSGSGPRPDPGQSGSVRPHRPTSKGFGPPFETTHGFGRSALFGRAKTGPDLFEVDGEALVIVEDGFDIAAGGETKGFSIRSDTLVVGALLATGLLVSAFLLGRTSGDEAPKVAIVVEAEGDETTTASDGDKGEAPGEVVLPPANSGTQTAPPQQVQAPAPVQPQTQRRTRQPTTLKASAPAVGRYELIVASTTPKSATKLAEWFKKNPLSPIFGRSDLQVIASKRGRVSIRGFQKTEGTVLKRVRATQDPLGGSGSFGDAYFKRFKR